MIEVRAYITLEFECSVCGHNWRVFDYDWLQVAACINAWRAKLTCGRCKMREQEAREKRDLEALDKST